MITEDDLIQSLRLHADNAGDPSVGLLSRVEGQAQRRRRTTAIAGVSASFLIAAATIGVVAHQPTHHPAVTLTATGTPRFPPAIPPANPTAESAVEIANDGLTGSTCDSPGPALPVDYLSWPCVSIDKSTSLVVLNSVLRDLNDNFGGLTEPRIRVIAYGPESNTEATIAFLLWDGDHLMTPALVNFVQTNRTVISGSEYAPPGDPAILASPTSGEVLARSPIASVKLQPQGTLLTLTTGIAPLPGPDNLSTTSVVGLDANGMSRPGWTIQRSISKGVITEDMANAACSGHVGTGTCQGSSTLPANASVAEICQSPTGTPPPRYLDWPCATPADSGTGHRVAVAEAAVLAMHPRIIEPRVRLLADTRTDGSSVLGPVGTFIEVWDAAGTGPAVQSAVEPTQDGSSGVAWTGGFNAIPAGDPAIFLDGGIAKGHTLVYTRGDIVSLTFTDGTSTTTVPVTGGVTSFPISATDAASSNTSAWRFTGKDSDGAVVASIPWAPTSGHPACTSVSTTCTPDGYEPTFEPHPTPTP